MVVHTVQLYNHMHCTHADSHAHHMYAAAAATLLIACTPITSLLSQVAKRYAKSWLLTDLLAAIPLDTMLRPVLGHTKFMLLETARGLRLLKVRPLCLPV
jgi:hypothetical protein